MNVSPQIPSRNKPMLDMQSQEGVVVDSMVCVYRGSRSYTLGDVEVMPMRSFLEALHKGDVFQNRGLLFCQ